MFCRIYIKGKNVNEIDLLISISNVLKGKLVKNQYIEKTGYSIEIRTNDEFDFYKAQNFPDGFLFFPYSIEIDIIEDIKMEDVVNEISKILNFFWQNSFTAIASCDFENLLPEKGGYKSKKIPWF